MHTTVLYINADYIIAFNQCHRYVVCFIGF